MESWKWLIKTDWKHWTEKRSRRVDWSFGR